MLGPKSFAAAAAAVSLLCAVDASATGVAEASSTGKGIVGGALLGAEVVVLTEAVLGVKPYWAYAVGGAAGAVAGGVGGYFLEDSISTKSNMMLLSGGMVLVIPTLIAMLSATAYEPPTNFVQDQAPSDEPVANPPEPEATGATSLEHDSRAPAKVAPRLRSRTTTHVVARHEPSLVGLSKDGFSLGVPNVVASNIYTRRELALYKIEQGTELRLPVLNWVF